jgi:protein-L-isoaspartate(D-aspartate) O-methyltransferase
VDDQVSVAINHVVRDRYLRTADGRQLPQTSTPELIATMLRLLDVQPGQRVLEVGTGSGYSTALLAHLVGAGGQVISLDVDPTWSRAHVGCSPWTTARHGPPRRRPTWPSTRRPL